MYDIINMNLPPNPDYRIGLKRRYFYYWAFCKSWGNKAKFQITHLDSGKDYIITTVVHDKYSSPSRNVQDQVFLRAKHKSLPQLIRS